MLARAADAAEAAGSWLAWKFGSLSSFHAGSTELVPGATLQRGAAHVGATGCLVFASPDGSVVDVRVRVLSPGVALLQFCGGTSEGGACPSGTTVRCGGAAVPFDARFGGYLVGLRDACHVQDALSGRPAVLYATAAAHRPTPPPAEAVWL